MKKHAPIEQLRKAGELAKQQLIAKGLMSTDNIDIETAKKHPGLILPGIPSYIPHKWTIQSAQRIMYDILKMWQFSGRADKEINNISLFITFCIKEMNHQEAVAKKKMDTTGVLIKYIKKMPVMGKIFEPVNQYETIKALKKFFVDSFAVAIIVKENTATTEDYAEFFFEWTDGLYSTWEKQDSKELKIDAKKENKVN